MPAKDELTASEFFSMRSELIKCLQLIDTEIDKTLGFKSSKRAADKARQLFSDRAKVADELLGFGVEVDPHSAVT